MSMTSQEGATTSHRVEETTMAWGFAFKPMAMFAVLLFTLAAQGAFAATENLGKGFFDHGVATPVSDHRGIVATVDGEGPDVVLAWLFDHRGGYALLLIDAETGKSGEFPMPFPPGGDCPYSSILSSGNKFYTHFNSHFVEFDPVNRAFTFFQKTAPQMAMGMTEDDNGVIWSVTYPQSGVVSFNPRTRELKDYGHVYTQNWAQYQRYVAADDAGWIYFGIGYTACQIIAFDPTTAKRKPILPAGERVKGTPPCIEIGMAEYTPAAEATTGTNSTVARRVRSGNRNTSTPSPSSPAAKTCSIAISPTARNSRPAIPWIGCSSWRIRKPATPGN
jgi:hypothetical protein